MGQAVTSGGRPDLLSATVLDSRLQAEQGIDGEPEGPNARRPTGWPPVSEGDDQPHAPVDLDQVELVGRLLAGPSVSTVPLIGEHEGAGAGPENAVATLANGPV